MVAKNRAANRQQHDEETAAKTADGRRRRDEKAAANRQRHDEETERRRVERAADKEAQREANRAAHAERNDEWQERKRQERERKQDPLNDPHTIEMARRNKMTPQEFLDWQVERRREMAKIPPYEEQMRNLRPIDLRPGEKWEH